MHSDLICDNNKFVYLVVLKGQYSKRHDNWLHFRGDI